MRYWLVGWPRDLPVTFVPGEGGTQALLRATDSILLLSSFSRLFFSFFFFFAGPELLSGSHINWYHVVRQRCLPSWISAKEKRQNWKNFFFAQMHDIELRKAKCSLDSHEKSQNLEIIERRSDGYGLEA